MADVELSELELAIAEDLKTSFRGLLNDELSTLIAQRAAEKADSYFRYRAARVHGD